MKQILPIKPSWHYLMFAYSLFAAGFFFLTRSKYHNTFFYITILTPYIFSINTGRLKTLLQSSILRLTIAYLGILTTSVLWASPPEPNKLSQYLFHFFYLIAFIALTIELMFQKKEFPDIVFKAVLASATIWIPVSIFLFYQDNPWSARLEGVGRLHNPISGGLMFGMVAILCLHALTHKADFSPFWRSLSIACVILCLVYMSLTQSRSPAISLLIAGILYTSLQGNWKILLSIIGVAIASGIAFSLDILPLDLVISRGLSYRPDIWMLALSDIAETPWLGQGASFDRTYHLPNHTDILSHTHSALIASLLFVGIAGTSILLMLIVQSFRYAFRTGHLLAASLLIYAIINLLINGYKLLDHPQIEWLYFWFPIALIAASEVRSKNQFS